MVTPNTVMFPGSNHVYIRYHDILGTPRFSVMLRLVRGNYHPGLFNFSFLEGKKNEDLVSWYVNRKTENFLDDEQVNIHQFTPDETERILDQLLRDGEYDSFIPVNLMDAFILHPIVDHLHIYSKHYEAGIRDYIGSHASRMSDVNYLTGDIEQIIKDAKDQCTIITNCSNDIKKFANPKYPNRYFIYIHPNNYDPIQSLSDIYATYKDRVSVIDISSKLKLWEEAIT